VRDDVDHELCPGLVGAQPLHQGLGVLPRVDAEGLVVEADDRVVRRDGRPQEPLAVDVDGQGTAERTDRGGEGAVDEEQDAHRTVSRQVQLVEGLEAPPRGDLRVGEVHQAWSDVRLHLLDGRLQQGRSGEPEDEGLGCALREVAEESPRAGVLRQVRADRRFGLDVDLEPGCPRARAQRPRPLRRVHRQVPRVDAVPLEQHDRVLLGRHVDLEVDLAGRVSDGCVQAPARAGHQVDLLHEGEVAVLERTDERVLAHVGGVAGFSGESSCCVGGGRLRVVRRRRGDAYGTAGKGRRHALLPPLLDGVHGSSNLEP
jgi:hypothetical protein